MLVLELPKKSSDKNNCNTNYQNISYKIIKKSEVIMMDIITSLSLDEFIVNPIGYKKNCFFHNLDLKKVYEDNNKNIITIELRSASNQLDFFSKHIVHNLNNLLTTINNNSFFLENKLTQTLSNNNQDIIKIITDIKDTSETASNMARNFLNFQYAQRNNIKEKFILKDIINECYKVLNFSFNRFDIKNIIIEEVENLIINTEKHLITQVLLAIYINAIDSFAGKFSNKLLEKVNNKISTVINQIDEDVIIKIYDNGSGIKDKIKDKILKSGFSTKQNGTGLGLAMTKEIIESLNGKMSLSSKENEFTEIMLRFKM